MSYKIAIASGKGGTGKTTVSVNLLMKLNDNTGGRIQLVDCDVEEPNNIIFFNDADLIDVHEISQLIPSIDKDKCTFCRMCVEYCEFNAIVVIPSVGFAEVNPGLCHSCGACTIACDNGAISEKPEPIGIVNFHKTQKGYLLAEGKLKIGSVRQTLLIKELKKRISDSNDITIYDAPPGTSCPVVETIIDVNFVILVAEPTLFGLYDLKLMVNLVRELKIPFGVIINKAGLGSKSIYEYLIHEDIELLGEIPFSKEYASLYAEGKLLELVPDAIRDSYSEILIALNRKIMQNEGDNHFEW